MILKLNKDCTFKDLEDITSRLMAENIEHYLIEWKGRKIIICNSDLSNLPRFIESQIIDKNRRKKNIYNGRSMCC
jgi:3-deoxy-7-phosphoheptulonate synthase